MDKAKLGRWAAKLVIFGAPVLTVVASAIDRKQTAAREDARIDAKIEEHFKLLAESTTSKES